jgi:hypothetical protein
MNGHQLIDVNIYDDNYIVYVNDADGVILSGYENYASNYVENISFSVGGTARGDFYVDNIFAPAIDRHKLDINVVGNGSVNINPGEATYNYSDIVELTAIPDPGWSFDHWEGNITGTSNPESLTMDYDKNIIACFTEDQYTLSINTIGGGSVNIVPIGISLIGAVIFQVAQTLHLSLWMAINQ